MNFHNEKVPYYTFDKLDKTGLVRHAFSTKHGGVSEGYLSSLNLGYEKGDLTENVNENYQRIANVLGFNTNDMVMTNLEHSTNVIAVTAADKGKGFRENYKLDYCDGIITNEQGLVLVCRYADCVPLFFLDPINKAIGISHSGWRGTAKRMAKATIEKMKEVYGTNAKDIIAGIGPSINKARFEVKEDVASVFMNNFSNYVDKIIEKKDFDTYLIDLWQCNKIAMMESGVKEENIEISGLCTASNSDIFFSHRATNGKRGDLAGFISLV